MTINLGERKSKTTLVSDIAESIRDYFALGGEPQEFVPGKTRIPLNVPTYGAAEVIEAMDSLLTTWVTMGKKVKTFEEMFAAYIGQKNGIMVNSGSSANLLALSALKLKPGDEVITPALTWATTVFPIAQVGAVPVLVDVDRESYNISPEAIERAITPKTRAIMPVHLLGNPCNMDAICEIAYEKGRRVTGIDYGLLLLEDCCEAHGAEYHGRKVGSFGFASTFSFFFSHHISTIEGGLVLTPLQETADILRSMRAHGWIRDMSNRDEIAAANPSIDPRFEFATVGYNFRPTEIQGAFGMHQLPRLDGFVEHRRELAAYFNEALVPYRDWLMLPTEAPNTRHSYFAYGITVKEDSPFTKKQLVTFLESKGLETRQIEAGCISLQPAMKSIKYRAGDLTNADYIHRNGFFFGLHQGVGLPEREAIGDYFHQFFAMIGAT